MDDDAVEAVAIGAEPREEGWGVPALLGCAQGVDGKGKIAEEGSGWVIEGGEFGAITRWGVANEHAYGFAGASGGGVNRADDVKNSHGLRGGFRIATDARVSGDRL